ncbi:MarR family winged helix-turn-helix transcriptional regulator [Aureispira anguillae]|uniref:MarR family transcriptional regulator n=1 Tax=Aureispira anguillae TaxID=2864201 RepID=A0A915YLP1_9BACT|nr:MarR family transcriptional regulator [Aureispira anguillae]BDS15527.1 MarR family transcriptional regulator [Aureispira anguillae]
MSEDLRLDDVYIFLLERVSKRFKKYAKAELGTIGVKLSSDQWVVLKRVSERPGTTQREIATSTYKDPASITRILDLLQKENLIKREGGNDRRSFGIYLTDKGAALVQKILPTAVEIRAKGLEGISEDEKLLLNRLLKKIHDNFDK